MDFLLVFLCVGITGVSLVKGGLTYQVDDWSRCPASGSGYHQIIEVSITVCVKECVQRGRCAGIGYRRRLLLCELYTESDLLEHPDHVEDLCIFIRREHMYAPSNQVLFLDCQMQSYN